MATPDGSTEGSRNRCGNGCGNDRIRLIMDKGRLVKEPFFDEEK